MIIWCDTLHWSDVSINRDLVAELDLITKFREVSLQHLQRVWLANRTLTPLGHLVLSHLGLASVLIQRPFSPELAIFPDFEFQTSIGTSYLCIGQFPHSNNILLCLHCGPIHWDLTYIQGYDIPFVMDDHVCVKYYDFKNNFIVFVHCDLYDIWSCFKVMKNPLLKSCHGWFKVITHPHTR